MLFQSVAEADTIPPQAQEAFEMRRIAVTLVLLVSLVMPAAAEDHKIIAPPGSRTDLPFSPAVMAGDFLYLSGSLSGESADVKEQVKQTLENLKATLKAADMDLSHVVSATVYLSDARYFSAMNEVYRSYLPDAPPVRATVQADIAIPAALAEIAMIAVKPGVERKVVMPAGVTEWTAPYSPGIMAGNTLFTAGMVGRKRGAPAAEQPMDVAGQTSQALANVEAVLTAAGMRKTDVTSCNVYLPDARHFQDMNGAYRAFFSEAPPARATVRAGLMGTGLHVEIMCVAVKGGDRRIVGPRRPNATLSRGIRVGDRLFLSGITGRGPDGYAPGDVKAQTRQALETIKGLLAEEGMDFTNVVRGLVWVTDIRDFQSMNEIYREFLPSPAPARATVGAPLMSSSALVEIMMVAVEH